MKFALIWFQHQRSTPVLFVEPHPLLDLHAFVAMLPRAVGDQTSDDATGAILARAIAGDDLARVDDADAGALRTAVRDLLRHGGFKPSGRNKPASEYLARNALPRISLAVDAGNAVSLHAGLPVSVIDADRLSGEALRVAIAPPGTAYPFNPSGQVFDASGLVCLFDGDGVSATPVKDAQRTKTSPSTTRTLCLVWGVTRFAEHGRRVAAGYRALLERLGATVTPA